MDASNDPARLPTPARRGSIDGGPAAPVDRTGKLARALRWVRESTWASVVTRGLGIGAGMVALAAIGGASTLSGAGVAVATAAPGVAASATVAKPGVAAAGSASVSAPSTPSAVSTVGASATSAGVTTDGKVVLNAATADDLMKLPRVGAKRAQAILEVRRRLGRFRQPTDLLRVKGIGHKTLRLILPLVVVDDPSKTTPAR